MKFSINQHEIQPLDTRLIDPPNDEVFASVQDTFGVLPVTAYLSEGERNKRLIRDLALSVALHWVYKKARFGDKKHKIPYPRSLAEMYRPDGEILLSYFELVKDLHALDGCGYGARYKNAGQWFKAICLEVRDGGFWGGGGNGKAGALAILRERTKQYRNAYSDPEEAKNPHDKRVEPALFEVFEAVRTIRMGNTTTALLKEPWVCGVIKSLSSFTKTISQENYKFATIENDQILAYLSPAERKKIPGHRLKGGKIPIFSSV